jgi:5-oxopent-3-ene-1,2,5-tricarboxylate decarboxylase / 2-hydroxyhepta-2,4-diene-1,7-dioate isomerase
MTDASKPTDPLSDETIALLHQAATATLTAQLQRRGIRNSFLTGLTPTRPQQRMVGVAKTLRYGAMREDMVEQLQSGFNAQRQAIESLQPGEVLVIEARDQVGAGTIGDVMCERARQRGAVGVVTDGAVRDGGAVADIELSVYRRAVHGATFSREHLPLDFDLPITCAGVLVMPGDVVVGDGDGVVIIPRALAAEVASDGADQELKDAWAYERACAGDALMDVMPLPAHRRGEFEQWLAARGR